MPTNWGLSKYIMVKLYQGARHWVANTCNLSYSGSRDQYVHGSKPAQENSWQDPILKKTHHKNKAGIVA
jgi:hypothetical protein